MDALSSCLGSCHFPFPLFVCFFFWGGSLYSLKTHKVTSSKKKGISRAPNICQIGVIFFVISKPSKLPPLSSPQLMALILISQGKHPCQNRTLIHLPLHPWTYLHLYFSPITMDKTVSLLNPKCTWAIPFLPANSSTSSCNHLLSPTDTSRLDQMHIHIL